MFFFLHSWKSIFLKGRFTLLFFSPTSFRLCSELVFCQKQQGELAGDPNLDGREPVDPVVRRLAEGQSVNSDWLPGQRRERARDSPRSPAAYLPCRWVGGRRVVRGDMWLLWLWCAALAHHNHNIQDFLLKLGNSFGAKVSFSKT